MAVFIRKFIITNNFGNVNFTNGTNDNTFTASRSINGATGPTVVDVVNGRRVQNQAGISGSNINTNVGNAENAMNVDQEVAAL
ncbi:hypothetical protein ACFDTO_29560 [Microbacteriaceae bacterium 4G12]